MSHVDRPPKSVVKPGKRRALGCTDPFELNTRAPVTPTSGWLVIHDSSSRMKGVSVTVCYSLAMARPMAGRATYEDLSRVADDLVAEIVDGELFTTPRPATPHAYVSSRLTAEIDIPFSRGRGGPGGWWILIEPELHVGEDVVVPDVAGWRHASLPVIPDAAFLTTPPDWVCEVLSPSTERLDRARKLGVYARERVGFVWLINPRPRTLEVLRLAGAGWALVATYADADVVRAPPFEAIALELASLWLPEKPPA